MTDRINERTTDGNIGFLLYINPIMSEVHFYKVGNQHWANCDAFPKARKISKELYENAKKQWINSEVTNNDK